VPHARATFRIALPLLLLVAAGLGAPRAAGAGVDGWTTSGPPGGRTDALALDPTTSTLYAGTPGGVFRSVDGGASWVARSNGLRDLSVQALAIDPATPTTLYAGTQFGGGVFKTIDGGASWTSRSIPASAVLTLAIDPVATATVYAGTNLGLFKSTDGGGTWVPANNGLDTLSVVTAIAIDPTAPSTLYVGKNGGGVFKSTDAGATWNPSSTGLTDLDVAGALVIDPTNPLVLYVGTRGGGVFKSTNGGASWNPSSMGLGSLEVFELAIDPLAPLTLFAVTNAGVHRTTNGGATWELRNTGLACCVVPALAVDPRASGIVYAAVFSNGVFRTIDGGGIWTTTGNAGLSATEALAVVLDPMTPTTLYAGTFGGGVFKSTDRAATWNASNNGLAISAGLIVSMAIDPVAPSRVYAGSNGTGLFRSTDGAASWFQRNNGLPPFPDIRAIAVDPLAPTTVYVGTFAGQVFRSTDDTAMWIARSAGLPGRLITALAIDPATPAILYAGTLDAGVFKSTSAADAWSPASAGLTNLQVRALAIDPATPATVYAGTFGGGVFRSLDGGTTWNPRNGNLPDLRVTKLAIDPVTPATLYAGTFGGGVFRSTDGGASWSAFSTGLVNGLIQALAIDPVDPSRLYAGTQGSGVFAIQQQLLATLTVARAGSGGGTVTSDLAGLSCGADCVEPYPRGTVVRLTAVADAGSTFIGFSGAPDCASGVVTMTTDKGCTATFSLTPSQATLTVSRAGSGSGSVTSAPAGLLCGIDCSETYPAGTVVALLAVPDAGAAFIGWSGSPDCVDGVVTLSQDTLCVASFSPVGIAGVSLGAGGASADGESFNPSISADGRFVAFESTATNLGGPCTTGIPQVFVLDRATGTATCVSVTAAGGPGDRASAFARISADGRVVTFQSAATNLASPCTTGGLHVYARTLTGAPVTTCLSVTPGGGPANAASSRPAISGDGRLVAFESNATNLETFPLCTTGVPQIFVRDRVTGQATCMSLGPGSVPGNLASSRAAINGDGSVVAFESSATNLDPSCGAGGYQVFVRAGSTTACASVGPGGVAGNAGSEAPAISADGTLVAFESVATNLTATCRSGVPQVYVRDRAQGTTRCVSVTADGLPGDGASTAAAISGDGSTVAFSTTAANLLGGAAGAAAAVGSIPAGAHAANGSPLAAQMVASRLALGNVQALMTQGAGGAPGNQPSRIVGLSFDGRTLAFDSQATNLRAGDDNQRTDVFVVQLEPPPPPGAFVLMVAKGGAGSGTVTSAPGGIVCGTDCSEPYASNAVVTLTAQPGAGSIFAGWSGAGCAGTGPCPVTVTAHATVTATFDPIAGGFFALSVATRGGGTGTVTSTPPGIDCGTDCTEAYPAGTLVTLEAAPSGDSVFGGFQGGGCGGTGPCVVTVTENLAVTAIFAPPGRVVITAPLDGAEFPLTTPTPVTFTWTALPGVTRYGLEFTGANRRFANPNGAEPDPVNGFLGAGGGLLVDGTSLPVVLEPTFPPGSYQVRVIGVSATGAAAGTFSDAVTIVLGSAKPALTDPAPGTRLSPGGPVALVWTALEGITNYLVEVTGVNLAFSNPNGTITDPVNGFGGAGGGVAVSGTTLAGTVPPGTPAGSYQVRVIGRLADGQFVGRFSDAVTLIVE
jgi:photosystem II stability/assembly factor-like uncharacterized protein/Tol biopolymer transport system component